MNVLGVILARAGSVGLRNKHLLPLCGKLVVEYSIEHARSARMITRVVVSSDCPKVREIAGIRGVECIVRPSDLAQADSSVQDVLLHAMLTVESQSSFRADAVVTIYGNVPVRKRGIIDEAIGVLAKTGCDSVRSFVPVGKWHPAWMARMDGDRVSALQPRSIHRRQDLEPLFLHDGAVVVSSRRAMDGAMNNRQDPHAFFGVDRRAVFCEATETVEIDSRRDLLLADAILKDQRQQAVKAA